MYFFQQSDYAVFQNQLGDGAKLGMKFYLLNSDGTIAKQDGFNNIQKMPMASTMKIAIGLLVLKKVFDEHLFELDDPIKIANTDFSPGPPWNILDRYYFAPWHVENTKTVNELFSLMLQDSDNTATDKLLELIGGTGEVNTLMNQLGLDGFHLSSTLRNLLSDYYDFNGEKSFFNSIQVFWNFLSAFNIRPTEKTLFTDDHDVCTPDFMANLVSLLVKESTKEPSSWLPKAAKLLCSKMELCSTGLNLIRKGANSLAPHIIVIGDKTGSLGGIINDTAFIHLDNEQWAILSICTCLSPLEKVARQNIIAELTTKILKNNLDFIVQEAREDMHLLKN